MKKFKDSFGQPTIEWAPYWMPTSKSAYVTTLRFFVAEPRPNGWLRVELLERGHYINVLLSLRRAGFIVGKKVPGVKLTYNITLKGEEYVHWLQHHEPPKRIQARDNCELLIHGSWLRKTFKHWFDLEDKHAQHQS